MPRPPLYDSRIWMNVFLLRRAHPEWGHARITAELRAKLGRATPSERTVARFLQKVSAAERKLAGQQQPWRAWDAHDSGLPPGATPYLLEMVGALQALELFPKEPRLLPSLWDPETQSDPREDPKAQLPELTKQQALWAWRIHSAAPDLSLHDVFWTAQDIVARELVHAVLEQESEFDPSDLHFLLSLKPWQSASRYRRYLKSVRARRIPRYSIAFSADIAEAHSIMTAHPPEKVGERVWRYSIPSIPGDYSTESMFIPRQCPGLELIRRRALRNDFGFKRTWRSVRADYVSPHFRDSRVRRGREGAADDAVPQV